MESFTPLFKIAEMRFRYINDCYTTICPCMPCTVYPGLLGALVLWALLATKPRTHTFGRFRYMSKHQAAGQATSGAIICSYRLSIPIPRHRAAPVFRLP